MVKFTPKGIVWVYILFTHFLACHLKRISLRNYNFVWPQTGSCAMVLYAAEGTGQDLTGLSNLMSSADISHCCNTCMGLLYSEAWSSAPHLCMFHFKSGVISVH